MIQDPHGPHDLQDLEGGSGWWIGWGLLWLSAIVLWWVSR